MQTYESTTTRLTTEELGACALVQDLLPLYLEGEVSPGSRELIGEHLARCERCAGFMAGAQSVRAQLRREALQRGAASAAAAPERRTLRRWQQLLVGGVVFMICAVGGLASIGLAAGLRYPGSDGTIVGTVAGFGALVALLLLARALGPLRSERGAQIAGGVAVGIGSAFLIVGSVGIAQGVGIILAMAAVFAVELSVLSVGPARGLARGAAA